MTTRILDIEIAEAGRAFEGLGSYDRALILLRKDRAPLGQVALPVRGGRIAAGAVRAAIPDEVITRWAMQEESTEPLLPPQALTATVAICTRERPDDLERALAAVTAMPHRGGGVLVVDNAPTTDATCQVVARFPGVRYVVEPRKGLNNARNRALSEAGTDIVSFIDDDAVADIGWLDAILQAFADPTVDCVTGLTMPLELESQAQEDFETFTGFSRIGFVGRRFHSPPHHPLAVGGVGAGVNMSIRRRAWEKAGLFDPALDAGTVTMSGGDHDYFHRLLLTGHTIVYEPRALNWHRHRRTHEEMVKAIYGYGVGVYSAFTRAFLVEKEWGVFLQALRWLTHDQLPNLWQAILKNPRTRPLDVCLAELRGCSRGPFAYMTARKQAIAQGGVAE